MSDLVLDPVTRQHIERAAENLRGEFEGVFSKETIERFIAESTDLLGEARVNTFVPVLVHRFTRERLKALAQAEGEACQDDARGALRVRAQRRPQPDGRGPRPSCAPTGACTSGSAGTAPPARRSTRRSSPPWPSSAWTWARSSPAAHRRGCARRRRLDHDGLRRRLPDLPRQALRGLGPEDPPARASRRCARSATRSTRACNGSSPSCSGS